MRGYARFGLLAGILGAGALLSSGAGIRAAAEQAQHVEQADPTAKAKGDARRRLIRKFERRIEPGGARGGFLGVGIEDVGKDDLSRLRLGEARGAVVKSVEPSSAAAKAGLQEGDVILRFQSEPVWSAAQFRRLLRETPAGRTVSLELSRDGAARTVSATLGERSRHAWNALVPDLEPLEELLSETPEPPAAVQPPEPPGAPAPPHPRIDRDRVFRFEVPEPERWLWRGGLFHERGPRKLGIAYQPVSGQLARYFKLEGDEGILVTSVDESGPSAAAGVKAGDILLKVNGKSVVSGAALRDALASVDAGEEVSLALLRDGRPVDVKVKAAGAARRSRRGDTI